MNPLIKEELNAMTVSKITPLLLVEEVEPCVKFWVERLGFAKTLEVPEGNKTSFAILQKDAAEVMYQTYSSVEKDAPKSVSTARRGPTFLYVEVGNLDEIIAAMKGVEVVMPERLAVYGAREIGVKDPAGHFVTFAQFGVAPQP